MNLQHLAVVRVIFQQIAVRADINTGRGDDLFTDSVDRGVSDLREHLLEVVKQRRMLAAQHCKRSISTHCAARLCAKPGHWQHHCADLLVFIAKDLLQAGQLVVGIGRHLAVGDLQVAQLHKVAVDPFAVWLPAGIVFLEFFVVHDLAADRVHQQHFAGAQSVFDKDVIRLAVQHADLGG